MGYAHPLGKPCILTFDRSRVCEAVTIRSSAYCLADGEPFALAVGIAQPAVAFPVANLVAGALAVLLTVLALRGALRLRATTLSAPCLWTAVAGLCLAIESLCQGDVEGIEFSALQFSVAAMTFCPLMAVLGAKRPQHRGWQWVVLSLWIVLIWPAVQAVLLPAGVRVELFIAWKLFLWGLIGVGLLNYLPTRHSLAAVGVAMGQVILLQAHLGVGNGLPAEWSLLLGVSCFVLASLLIGWRGEPQSTATSQGALVSLNRRWRNFRDAYGAFWALRMLGRINQAAELRKWPWRLGWSRFLTDQQQPTAEQWAELEQTMTTILRRFTDERTS